MALRQADGFDPALPQRLVSGAVLALGTLLVVLVGGWLFVAMVLAVVAIMAQEWSRLAPEAGATARRAIAAAATVLPAVAVLALQLGALAAALAVLLLGTALSAAAAALLPACPPDRAAGGVLYVGLPATALVWLRNSIPGGLEHVLWLLVVVSATDIGAYVAGRSIGGPKLAPRISPGKTWAGLLGGMAGAALCGGLLALAFGAGFALAASVGAGLAVVAQAGDLFESALKRRVGVKDSGRLIPGHGGLLDRIDGVVFAAPLFACIVWLTLVGARP
jgi:phosphatidate cytidylyltransferase